ncbi:MAG: rRNA pseudouridine synthase [Chloroflexi bacterium]|nr:rRNA pseudouridine synthase [Chloroflexota bacterium]MCL5074702.1 rRNA pseudouridine synthase [Chloroflexota bacterium]
MAQVRVRGERLQKVLARAGIGSWRFCEQLIRQGRVAVNGDVVTELGIQVDSSAQVTLDGQLISKPKEHIYWLLNKPPGYVSTVTDPQGRPTVLDLAPLAERVYPVGRLDVDSEGLILLTNDGELAYRLTHPRYGVEKEYHVLIDGVPSDDVLRLWCSGVELDGRTTAPAMVEKMKQDKRGMWLRFVIHEGRKRQIRLMSELFGYRAQRLIRVRFGPLSLGCLPVGKTRPLAEEEIERLKRAVGLVVASR